MNPGRGSIAEPRAQGSPSAGEVREALERAYAAPEFTQEGAALEQALERLIEWLAELFDWDLPAPAFEAGAQVVLWIVLVVLCLVLVLLLVRLAREARRTARQEREALIPAQVAARVAELHEQARAAEARGDWLEALRLDFFALVVGLGQRGDLQYRDSWTNRELLERGEPSPELARILAPLVTELDARSFGSLGAGPEDVRRLRATSERLLGGAA